MEEAGVKVGVQIDGQATLKQLKQDLKTAQGEALALSRMFGATSKEALEAAKKVSDLKDEINDLNERVALMDPGAKFQVFTNAINTVASGFAAAQGAMAAFGVESEDVQKQLLKVQGALALSQGLSAMADSWKDFERLGAVIKNKVVTAFSTLRGAIIATGIGALAVGIGALVANFEKVEEWLKKIIPGFDGFAKAFNKVKAVASGVLNGIIESFKVIGEIIADIFSGNFSEALDGARNAGKRIGAAYNEGFQEEIKDQAAEAARLVAEGQVKSDEIRLRMIRAAGAKNLKEVSEIEKKIARARIDAAKAGSDEQREAIVAFAELLEKQRVEQEGKLIEGLRRRQAIELAAMEATGKDTADLRARQNQELLSLQRKLGYDITELTQAAELQRIAIRKQAQDKEISDLQQSQAIIYAQAEGTGKNMASLRLAQMNELLDLNKKFGRETRDLEQSIELQKLVVIRTTNEKEIQELAKQHQLEIQTLSARGESTMQLRAAQLDVLLRLYQKFGLNTAAIEQEQAQHTIAWNQEISNKAIEGLKHSHAVELAEAEMHGRSAVELRAQQLDEMKLLYEQYGLNTTEITRQQQLAQLDIVKATEQGKQTALTGTAALAESLAGLAGEQTAAGKTLAIAGTTINTYQAAMQAYLNGQMIGGPYGIVAGVLAAAAAVATGVANVKRIVSVQVPGGASGNSAPSGVTPPPVAMVRQDTGTMLDQLDQVNSNLNQPSRVQVVESDITNTQNRVEVIENNAKF